MTSQLDEGDFPPDDDHWDAPPGWEAPVPDAVDRVVELGTMVSVFVADQYGAIEAMRRELLADAAGRGYQLMDVMERSIRLELAAALSITEASAGALIGQADALVNRYPAVLASLGGARMTQRHAVELTAALDGVEPEFRDRLLTPGIALAESQPLGTFRRRLRGLVESVRAVTLEQRHAEALQGRRVVVEPAEDGMAWLHAFVPAVEAHAIFGRVTGQAKVLAARPGEARTLDQLRADVFCDTLIEGVTDTLPPQARGIRATVFVTVPALALLDEHDDGRHGIATVEGVGPISMTRARELCGGAAEWMRVLTHPETGIVLSVGRTRYKTPPGLRRLVRWRAETCLAPGCNIPAGRCEIDHNQAWEDGGTTSLDNLAPFCKGHHIVKHHGDWDVEQIPNSGGAMLWTSPSGRHYRVDPERRVPVFVPSGADAPAPF